MKCDTPMTFEEAKTRLGIVDRKPMPMTNEEWLKLMTTEELAEWIYRAMFYKSCQKDVEDGAYMQMMTKKDYIENWLKEIHYDGNASTN